MERVNLFFLHGFLGRPSDWAVVKAHLPQRENLRIFTPDYFKEMSLGPQHSFANWGANFTKFVELHGCSADRNILIGYSLGGRLALHAFEKKPALWHKLILVSTNPGFNDPHETFDPNSEERRQRWMSDSYWAEEFLKAPWDMVIRNWNAQPVFGGGENEPVRVEKEYSRETLSLALTQWSLAQQKNMRPLLQKNLQKILWLTGERDEKFMEMSRRLAEEVQGLRTEVVPASSHRVIFDSPKELGERIKNLVQQLL
ncbi:alpha/beta fold hydrolase [Bdellovibrio sp. 22V]|uniref:alpha/beta fold hydrolase n=1 Tax=Bdellovibrio TaxID=958 RepID=UPI002542FA3A|nr:alpha/beta fold hydrolase [Bdellovibrio sp. 22V]WII72473.1 alpha/beta fold hydrolase [Bdellovibrio sp. 22V]